jgi:adenylate cyclase
MNPFSKQEIINQVPKAILSGALTAAFMYVLFFKGYQSILAGASIGFFVYFGISFYTNEIEKRYLRKTNLVLVLILNSVVQGLIIFIISWVLVGIFYAGGDFGKMLSNFSNLFDSFFVIGIIFGLLLSVFFNFYSIVTTLIGKNVLGKLFLGMYRNPIETNRVFMFLDLASSTSIAEKTGHLKFLSLVNDFFYDITEPVRQTKGEIYKYVGDEVIVTWKTKDAVDKANCIRCFFLIDELITKKAPYYIEKYGIVPGFKAGIHGGLSVTGELGYTKREIAYMGDVVNTTARIEEACKTYGKRLIVSEFLINQMELPAGISAVEVGNVKLRGKENELRLFSIEQDTGS